LACLHALEALLAIMICNKIMMKLGNNKPVFVLGALVLLVLLVLNYSFFNIIIDDDCRRGKHTTNLTTTDRLSLDVSLPTLAEIIDVDESRGNNDHASSSRSNLAIVTAFSKNHMLEGVAMLRTLIAVQFKEPVHIFLMKEMGEDTGWITEFKEELSKSPLSLHMIDFEVQGDALNTGTYCFKPTAMGVFLRRNRILPPSESAQVVMWSDASTRFLQNPSIWAKHIIQKEIDFVGRQTSWSIPQQTHRGTFDYFDMNPDDFNNHPTIAGGHFLVNLQSENIRRVLDRWVDCGVLDCHTCMAPLGSSKRDPNGAKYEEGGNEYVSHRQDQAVLTLLVTDYMKKERAEANVKIVGGGEGGSNEGVTPYFCLKTRRFVGNVKSVKDWNTTFTIPSHACEKMSTILKISSNSTIRWENEDFAT
jgi:hypothetical protein